LAGGFWTSWIGRLLTRKAADPAPSTAPPPDRPKGREPDRRLAGRLELLTRMVGVPPNSIAVLFIEGQPPLLKNPGEMLRPSLLPSLRPVHVLLVNTAPVDLDVTVASRITADGTVLDPVVTLDGYAVERVKIRVTVQLAAADHFAAVTDLAAEYGPDLESQLLRRVQNEVASEVYAAIRMNRLSDLRRLTLQQVLSDRWLPKTFAGGSLVRSAFTVLDVAWPELARPETIAPERPASPPTTPFRRVTIGSQDDEPSSLDLTMDARLRRLWSRHSETELQGISGAKVGGGTTVLAVSGRPPSAYEGTMLREIFGRHFDDRNVRLIAAVGDSYDDVVRAWFRQVDRNAGRLVSVRSTERDGVLRIVVDQQRDSKADSKAGPSVGRESDREALRQLLPHDRVEFLHADGSG
jgi:hypothetical protein